MLFLLFLLDFIFDREKSEVLWLHSKEKTKNIQVKSSDFIVNDNKENQDEILAP